MMGLRPTSLRARLTLWYVAVFGGILTLYAAGTLSYLYYGLREAIDHDLVEDIERTEPLVQFTSDGKLQLATSTDVKSDPDGPDEPYVEILSPDGRVLYRNERLGSSFLGGAPFAGEGTSGYSERSSRLGDSTAVRMASRMHEVGRRSVLIRIARNEEPLWREFKEVLSVLLLGLPLALAVAGFVSYGFAPANPGPIRHDGQASGAGHGGTA